MKPNLPRRMNKRLIRQMQPQTRRAVVAQRGQGTGLLEREPLPGSTILRIEYLDEGMRMALTIGIDTSLPVQRIVRALQQLEAWRVLRKSIRLDNGPELTFANSSRRLCHRFMKGL